MKKKPVKANKQFVEVYCEERSSLRGSPYTPPLKLNEKKARVMWAHPDTDNPFSALEERKYYASMSRVAVIPLDDIKAIVERASKAMALHCGYSSKQWDNLSKGFKDAYRAEARAALTAAGIPRKKRRAKQ